MHDVIAVEASSLVTAYYGRYTAEFRDSAL